MLHEHQTQQQSGRHACPSLSHSLTFPPLQVSSAGGARGYFYKVSLNLDQRASQQLNSYLGQMETFATFVSRAYILCSSNVRIEASGLALLVLAPPQAWPLDPLNAKSVCMHAMTALPGGR